MIVIRVDVSQAKQTNTETTTRTSLYTYVFALKHLADFPPTSPIRLRLLEITLMLMYTKQLFCSYDAAAGWNVKGKRIIIITIANPTSCV